MITLAGREVEVRVVEKDGSIISLLPHAQVQSMSWVLNGYGQMSFTQSTHSPGAEHAARLHEYEVQVWIDNSLVWWGQLMTESGGPGQQVIGCDGLESYFEDRIIDDRTMEWLSTEQFTIGADLVNYAQTEQYQANRDFNIGVSIPTPSGKVRTEMYKRNDHTSIYELLQGFTKLTDGFDWEVTFSEDGQRLWTPYFPQKGTVHNDLMLEYGKNITSYGFNRSAVNMRTQTYCAGGSAPNVEDGRIEQVYEDVAASAKYGVIQKVISEGTQMDPAWLLDRAVEDVRMGSKPSLLPDITAIELSDAELFGIVVPGDLVPLRIQDGARNVEGYFRVKSVVWNPDETLGFTFLNEEDL